MRVRVRTSREATGTHKALNGYSAGTHAYSQGTENGTHAVVRCPPRLLRGYSWIAKRARTRSLTRVPRGWKGPIVSRRRPVVCSARPATGGRPRVRVCGLRAGVTWTSRTATAPWAARICHTSVVDAAGAIYVLGGYSGDYLNDVWVGTDRGARAGLSSRGYCAVLGLARGLSRVLEGR